MITSPYSRHALTFPEKTAIRTKEDALSYREWDEAVRRTAAWFQSLGYENKCVCLYLPNGIPFLQVFAGAAAAGWTAVPLDLKWKAEELSKRLELSDPAVLITTESLLPKVNVPQANIRIWEECAGEIAGTAPMADAGSEDLPFYLGFTSGSTGSPKAFIRSHLSWIESFACTRREFQIHENDHVLIPGPLIHSHFLYGAISTLFIGGTLYLLEKFSPEKTLSVLKEQAVSVLYLVPTMAEALLGKNTVVEQDLKMISSGAKFEAHTRKRIRGMFPNLTLNEFYGAGELSFVSFSNDEKKPNSVGRPFHNVSVQIRRENGEAAAVDEIGKVYVRSPMTIIGYMEKPGEKPQPIADEEGWVTVHDMDRLDEEGCLYVAGRENNMILYGALNIFPEEIEAVLTMHPAVEKAAVVGLSDPYWGQITAAAVQGDAAVLELKRLCKAHLASYKVPRKWFFIEEMPLTTSGKIARGELRMMLEEKQRADLTAARGQN
ncbi:AMP-binding protein [Bacillus benzoevorans]|uniref:Long-chain acyl-CoA synthetase n=1 Tax=Bacillus benzoevorans TaxID=1456 RepID=A0A7X0HX35_9BACI|nr:long-chain acyl-CoA synthetase [Bacillus benzoevorans]